MLYITKNTDSELVFTAKERMTDFNNDLYLKLSSESSYEIKYTILKQTNNLSLFRRYDRFVVTEKPDPDTTSAEICLEPGSYKYEIYEWDSSENDYVDISNVLETGRLKVINTEDGESTLGVYD